MPGPPPGNDEERLPWLEAYREPPPAAARPAPAAASRNRGAGMAIGAIAALAGALTAGYYIGQRDPRPTPPAAEIAVTNAPPAPIAEPPEPAAPPPAPNATPTIPAVPPPVAEAAPPAKAAPEPAARKVASAAAVKKNTARVRQRQARSASREPVRARPVRVARQQPAKARAATPRLWPRMPSPGPAGQVIQLGAFRHPDGAYRAYRARLARYSALGRMPRVVVPVITKPGGRMLYVLRLGTTSRQQSRIVCRNLRASGDHCLVIG